MFLHPYRNSGNISALVAKKKLHDTHLYWKCLTNSVFLIQPYQINKPGTKLFIPKMKRWIVQA